MYYNKKQSWTSDQFVYSDKRASTLLKSLLPTSQKQAPTWLCKSNSRVKKQKHYSAFNWKPVPIRKEKDFLKYFFKFPQSKKPSGFETFEGKRETDEIENR